MTEEPKKISQNPEEVSRLKKEFESKFLKEYSMEIENITKRYINNNKTRKESLNSLMKTWGPATLMVVGAPTAWGLGAFHEFGHMMGSLSATGWTAGGTISMGLTGGQFVGDSNATTKYLNQVTASQMGSDYNLRLEYQRKAMQGTMSSADWDELTRLGHRWTELYSKNYDEYLLKTVIGGPLFDVISTLSLVLVTALLRKKHKFLAKTVLSSVAFSCANNIAYAWLGGGKSDYFKIAQLLDIPHSAVAGIFTAAFVGIIGLALLAAFYPEKIDKETKDYIKSLGIKSESGESIKESIVLEKWNKDYDKQLVNYVLSHFFKSDLSKLQRYEQKQYSADSIKYFDKINNDEEVYSLICASIFGLSAISKDYAIEFHPAKLFYKELLKISPIKDAITDLSKIAKKLTSLFEEVPVHVLKGDTSLIGIINQMMTDICNMHMKDKYNIALPNEKKINNLMLEILAAREMEKAYNVAYGENNENTIKIKRRLMELLKADTELYILFSALLDVYFEKDYINRNNLYGLIKENRVKNANHLIDKANSILENLPKKVKEFFVKKPEVLKELKQRAYELKIPDVDFENIKPIAKINKMTMFDYFVILDAVKSGNFNDDELVAKYSKILADALVKKTNDDYFEDPEKLSRKYEVDYNNLKKMWEETIKANTEYVIKLEKLTSSSIVEGGKKIIEEAKKRNVEPARIELVKQIISATV